MSTPETVAAEVVALDEARLERDLVATCYALDCASIRQAAIGGLMLQIDLLLQGVTTENKAIREGHIEASRRQLEMVRRWDGWGEVPR